MTHAMHLRAAGAVILVGLLALSSDLRWAWQHAPYDRFGWVLFLVWMGLAIGTGGRRLQPRMGGLGVAVGLGLISVGGDLNVARHAAIAVLVGTAMPGVFTSLVVTASAVAWWPALGWVVTQFMPGDGVVWTRMGVLVLALGGLILERRQRPTKETPL